MEVWKFVRNGRMGWPFSATVATIDFSVVDLNMEFVLASTDWCV